MGRAKNFLRRCITNPLHKKILSGVQSAYTYDPKRQQLKVWLTNSLFVTGSAEVADLCVQIICQM